jgi:hypothetical protein
MGLDFSLAQEVSFFIVGLTFWAPTAERRVRSAPACLALGASTQMFSLFVHTMNSDVPTLMLEHSNDHAKARRIAELALAESASSLLVEVRENDRLLFRLDRKRPSF